MKFNKSVVGMAITISIGTTFSVAAAPDLQLTREAFQTADAFEFAIPRWFVTYDWYPAHLRWMETQGMKPHHDPTLQAVEPGRYQRISGLQPQRADLTGAPLEGANLASADLRGALLTGATLTNADLTDAWLKRADLTGASLEGASLTRAYLNGALLTGASLEGASLTRAYLNGALLTGAKLRNADLLGATMTQADLSSALLWGVQLQEATLTGANLTNTNLVRARMEQADLSSATLKDANLEHAYAPKVNLTGADLSGADLREVNFSYAKLKDANLTGADLSRANLTRANLTGANLTGANMTGANLWWAALGGANLTGANVTNANLKQADLSLIILTGEAEPKTVAPAAGKTGKAPSAAQQGAAGQQMMVQKMEKSLSSALTQKDVHTFLKVIGAVENLKLSDEQAWEEISELPSVIKEKKLKELSKLAADEDFLVSAMRIQLASQANDPAQLEQLKRQQEVTKQEIEAAKAQMATMLKNVENDVYLQVAIDAAEQYVIMKRQVNLSLKMMEMGLDYPKEGLDVYNAYKAKLDTGIKFMEENSI